MILNECGAKWTEGISLFKDGVRDFLGPAHDLLFDISGKSIVARAPQDQERIDMFASYYEGMFLTPLNVPSVEVMLQQAKKEVGRGYRSRLAVTRLRPNMRL